MQNNLAAKFAANKTQKNEHGKAIFWQQHSDVVLNERQRTILNLYLDGYEGKFTAKNYAKLSDVSPDTALRDIRDLVARGLLRPLEGMQRNVEYEIMIENGK